MHEPFTKKLAKGSLKCASFWQSVLRFGLPFIILYRAIDYVTFRAAAGRAGLRYPWRWFEAIVDIGVVLFVSTLWWWFTREILAWRQRGQSK